MPKLACFGPGGWLFSLGRRPSPPRDRHRPWAGSPIQMAAHLVSCCLPGASTSSRATAAAASSSSPPSSNLKPTNSRGDHTRIGRRYLSVYPIPILGSLYLPFVMTNCTVPFLTFLPSEETLCSGAVSSPRSPPSSTSGSFLQHRTHLVTSILCT